MTIALVVSGESDAMANGAFPNSLQILVPADRPNLIVLATTFGLIISDDGGETWSWTCEPKGTTYTTFYQLGPGPQHRLYAVASSGLFYSDDESCNWSRSQGTLAPALALDVFVDPMDGDRVLAIGAHLGDGLTGREVYRSDDRGSTFGDAVFVAPSDGQLTSIEIARSDPHTVYLAMSTSPGTHPQLVHSGDRGDTWDSPVDLEPALGPNAFRIIAIDPLDTRSLFLRVSENGSESLAITRDGGKTFRKPVAGVDTLTAFVHLTSGTFLVTGVSNNLPVGFRSTDDGETFLPWPNVPNVRGLAERDGKLFVAADNFKDGFALAVSTDEGTTFQSLMTFNKVTSIKSCAQQACLDACRYQAGLKLWPMDTCCAGDADRQCPASPAPTVRRAGCGCTAADASPRPRGGILLIGAGALLTCLLRPRPGAARTPHRTTSSAKWPRPR